MIQFYLNSVVTIQLHLKSTVTNHFVLEFFKYKWFISIVKATKTVTFIESFILKGTTGLFALYSLILFYMHFLLFVYLFLYYYRFEIL